MARITRPTRPDPGRVQAARMAATRVVTASTQAAIAEEIAAIEAGIPPDLSVMLEQFEQRLSDLENIP